MATKIQRAKLILDTLADPVTVNVALAGRVADAFAAEYAAGQSLTNEQKAGLILQHLRNFVKERVRNAEVNTAVATARQTAATAAEIDIGEDGE